MKMAIVHDYFIDRGGAERVVGEFASMFPEADFFTSVALPSYVPAAVASRGVGESWLRRVVRSKRAARLAFPLFIPAMRSLDLSGYDVVVSSSSAFAHHIRVPRGTAHFAYMYTPPRFLYLRNAFFRGQALERALSTPLLEVMTRVDRAAMRAPDAVWGISSVVAERIERTYGRTAEVAFPPVDTQRFWPTTERSGRFVVVSRLIPYKRVDLAIRAANVSGLPLDIYGDGPAFERLKHLAGPTVRMMGYRPDDEVKRALATCIASILPGEEDFGLVPVETQASGRPAIAYAAGGALDTVRDGETGFLFHEQTVPALVEAMQRACASELPVAPLLVWVQRYDRDTVEAQMRRSIEAHVEGPRRSPEEPEASSPEQRASA